MNFLLNGSVYDVIFDVFKVLRVSQILKILFIHLRLQAVLSILKQMCPEMLHLR